MTTIDQLPLLTFYEQRYARGYMHDWPRDLQQRFVQVLQSLRLAPTGSAIDFGCGNGVLTDLARRALGTWTLCGLDISSTAIDNARRRFTECTFLSAADAQNRAGSFDLLFSHHVLEHVEDLDGTMARMSALLRPSAAMLHILPCGNRGSFEHRLCTLRTDGIDPARGNRFFFEDRAHLRRLSSDQLAAAAAAHGFRLAGQFYRNQLFGALDWVTESPLRFVRRMMRPQHPANEPAAVRLLLLQWLMIGLALARGPARFCRMFPLKARHRLRDHAYRIAALPLLPLSAPIDLLLKWLAAREWRTRSHQTAGSEMYLFFIRTP